jgi:hypothetical protein
MSAPERFKVSYSLRFDTTALPALGGLCASANLEVLNTTKIGNEVHVLARLCPDDIETVATSLSCEPRYESPNEVHTRCARPHLHQPHSGNRGKAGTCTHSY